MTANEMHGGSRTRLYKIWHNMRMRCANANNAAYGGRGITVCERWVSFSAFRDDVGEPPSRKHSLDRYPNVDGNYEPENVRWATHSEQSRNKRKSLFIEVAGERLQLADAAERYGIKYDTLSNRIHLGWPPEQAVNLVARPKPRGWKWYSSPRRRADPDSERWDNRKKRKEKV